MCLRVISGSARGLKLESLDGLNTRPTLDKVKQAIFNMLFDKTYDATVLDLFAGSGAMGIESLSRGSIKVTFVDVKKDAIDIINKNISKAKFTDKSTVVHSDYISFLQNCDEKFDIVFLDPPYDSDFIVNALSLFYNKNLLNKDAFIIIESARQNIPEIPEFYTILKQKFYGTVCVSLLEAKWTK